MIVGTPHQCTNCNQVKCLSDFHKCSTLPSGVKNMCKVCVKAYMHEWHKVRPPMPTMQSRDKHLRQRYGFDHAEYERLLMMQGGCCAICDTTEPGKGFRHFHIDHNHTSGRVRGLLCARCNQAVGLFKEDKKSIQRALSYLEAEGVQI